MLRSDIASRIGRADLGTGTSVASGASSMDTSNVGASASVGITSTGRAGLMMLGAIVIGLVAYAYWTR